MILFLFNISGVARRAGRGYIFQDLFIDETGNNIADTHDAHSSSCLKQINVEKKLEMSFSNFDSYYLENDVKLNRKSEDITYWRKSSSKGGKQEEVTSPAGPFSISKWHTALMSLALRDQLESDLLKREILFDIYSVNCKFLEVGLRDVSEFSKSKNSRRVRKDSDIFPEVDWLSDPSWSREWSAGNLIKEMKRLNVLSRIVAPFVEGARNPVTMKEVLACFAEDGSAAPDLQKWRKRLDIPCFTWESLQVVRHLVTAFLLLQVRLEQTRRALIELEKLNRLQRNYGNGYGGGGTNSEIQKDKYDEEWASRQKTFFQIMESRQLYDPLMYPEWLLFDASKEIMLWGPQVTGLSKLLVRKRELIRAPADVKWPPENSILSALKEKDSTMRHSVGTALSTMGQSAVGTTGTTNTSLLSSSGSSASVYHSSQGGSGSLSAQAQGAQQNMLVLQKRGQETEEDDSETPFWHGMYEYPTKFFTKQLELFMGQGKSKVLSPLLLAQIANAGLIPIIVFTDALHATGSRDMQQSVALLQKKTVDFRFSVHQNNFAYLKFLRDTLRTALHSHDTILATRAKDLQCIDAVEDLLFEALRATSSGRVRRVFEKEREALAERTREEELQRKMLLQSPPSTGTGKDILTSAPSTNKNKILTASLFDSNEIEQKILDVYRRGLHALTDDKFLIVASKNLDLQGGHDPGKSKHSVISQRNNLHNGASDGPGGPGGPGATSSETTGNSMMSQSTSTTLTFSDIKNEVLQNLQEDRDSSRVLQELRERPEFQRYYNMNAPGEESLFLQEKDPLLDAAIQVVTIERQLLLLLEIRKFIEYNVVLVLDEVDTLLYSRKQLNLPSGAPRAISAHATEEVIDVFLTFFELNMRDMRDGYRRTWKSMRADKIEIESKVSSQPEVDSAQQSSTSTSTSQKTEALNQKLKSDNFLLTGKTKGSSSSSAPVSQTKIAGVSSTKLDFTAAMAKATEEFRTRQSTSKTCDVIADREDVNMRNYGRNGEDAVLQMVARNEHSKILCFDQDFARPIAEEACTKRFGYRRDDYDGIQCIEYLLSGLPTDTYRDTTGEQLSFEDRNEVLKEARTFYRVNNGQDLKTVQGDSTSEAGGGGGPGGQVAGAGSGGSIAAGRALDEVAKEKLAITKTLLSGVMREALSKQANVHYGRSHVARKIEVAMPYKAADQPAEMTVEEMSLFKDPWECVSKTILTTLATTWDGEVNLSTGGAGDVSSSRKFIQTSNLINLLKSRVNKELTNLPSDMGGLQRGGSFGSDLKALFQREVTEYMYTSYGPSMICDDNFVKESEKEAVPYGNRKSEQCKGSFASKARDLQASLDTDAFRWLKSSENHDKIRVRTFDHVSAAEGNSNIKQTENMISPAFVIKTEHKESLLQLIWAQADDNDDEDDMEDLVDPEGADGELAEKEGKINSGGVSSSKISRTVLQRFALMIEKHRAQGNQIIMRLILWYLKHKIFNDKTQVSQFAVQVTSGPMELAAMPYILQGYSGTHEDQHTWHERFAVVYDDNNEPMVPKDEKQNSAEDVRVMAAIGFHNVITLESMVDASKVEKILPALYTQLHSDKSPVESKLIVHEKKTKDEPRKEKPVTFNDFSAFIDAGAYFKGQHKREVACKMLYLFHHLGGCRIEYLAFYEDVVPGQSSIQLFRYDRIFGRIESRQSQTATASAASGSSASKNLKSNICPVRDPDNPLTAKDEQEMEKCTRLSIDPITLYGSEHQKIAEALETTLPQLNEALVNFYDQSHVIGADLPNGDNRRAFTTVSEKVKRDPLAQGVMRMRGFNKRDALENFAQTQFITFVMEAKGSDIIKQFRESICGDEVRELGDTVQNDPNDITADPIHYRQHDQALVAKVDTCLKYYPPIEEHVYEHSINRYAALPPKDNPLKVVDLTAHAWAVQDDSEQQNYASALGMKVRAMVKRAMKHWRAHLFLVGQHDPQRTGDRILTKSSAFAEIEQLNKDPFDYNIGSTGSISKKDVPNLVPDTAKALSFHELSRMITLSIEDQSVWDSLGSVRKHEPPLLMMMRTTESWLRTIQWKFKDLMPQAVLLAMDRAFQIIVERARANNARGELPATVLGGGESGVGGEEMEMQLEQEVQRETERHYQQEQVRPSPPEKLEVGNSQHWGWIRRDLGEDGKAVEYIPGALIPLYNVNEMQNQNDVETSASASASTTKAQQLQGQQAQGSSTIKRASAANLLSLSSPFAGLDVNMVFWDPQIVNKNPRMKKNTIQMIKNSNTGSVCVSGSSGSLISSPGIAFHPGQINALPFTLQSTFSTLGSRVVAPARGGAGFLPPIQLSSHNPAIHDIGESVAVWLSKEGIELAVGRKVKRSRIHDNIVPGMILTKINNVNLSSRLSAETLLAQHIHNAAEAIFEFQFGVLNIYRIDGVVFFCFCCGLCLLKVINVTITDQEHNT